MTNNSVFDSFSVLNFAEESYLKTLIIMPNMSLFPELKLIAYVYSEIVISKRLSVLLIYKSGR
jgi:hypothetical protein